MSGAMAKDVTAYLDDLICLHSGFQERLKSIERLLQTIRIASFKLSGKKWQFATRSVKFLDHVIIDKDGITAQPEKLDEADLRRFLGVCTFWGRFVNDFAHIEVPLYDLLNKSEFV